MFDVGFVGFSVIRNRKQNSLQQTANWINILRVSKNQQHIVYCLFYVDLYFNKILFVLYTKRYK